MFLSYQVSFLGSLNIWGFPKMGVTGVTSKNRPFLDLSSYGFVGIHQVKPPQLLPIGACWCAFSSPNLWGSRRPWVPRVQSYQSTSGKRFRKYNLHKSLYIYIVIHTVCITKSYVMYAFGIMYIMCIVSVCTYVTYNVDTNWGNQALLRKITGFLDLSGSILPPDFFFSPTRNHEFS